LVVRKQSGDRVLLWEIGLFINYKLWESGCGELIIIYG